jgi:hypothetical protein
MTRRGGRRGRAAKRKSTEQTKLMISTDPEELRTLTTASRKKIQRENTRRLWIFSGDKFVYSSRKKAKLYPQASFLGLPAELRQEILYRSYSLEDLENGTFASPLTDERRKERLRWNPKVPLEVLGSMFPTPLDSPDTDSANS